MNLDPIIEEEDVTLATLSRELEKAEIPYTVENEHTIHFYYMDVLPARINLRPLLRLLEFSADLNWVLDRPDEALHQAYCDGVNKKCGVPKVFMRTLERDGKSVRIFTAAVQHEYWDGIRIGRFLKACRTFQDSIRHFQAEFNPEHNRPVESIPGLLEYARDAILYYQSASASKLQRAIGVNWHRCNEVISKFEGDLISTRQHNGARTVLPRVLDLTHTDHPINTYWLEPEALLVGEYPGAPDAEVARRKLQDLLDRGFTAFLDLTEAGELSPYEPMLDGLARERGIACEYRRMPLQKLTVPADPREMNDILIQLYQWQKNHKIYLHGSSGAGRASMVAGCYLFHFRSCENSDAAQAQLQLLWTRMSADRQYSQSQIPVSQAQRDYVLNWQEMEKILYPQTEDPFSMNWFKRLTGFAETDYETTRAQLCVEGNRLRSLANGSSWQIGRLETPSLAELRERAAPALASTRGTLNLRNVKIDMHRLHIKRELKGALIQVASQFNLLEIPNHQITPEHGVSRYESDAPQLPTGACAAGPATIYRNYFAPVGDRIGQTQDHQIDTLADLRSALPGGDRIEMRNGYALVDTNTLQTIKTALEAASVTELDALRARLRIGLHHDVEVTAFGAAQEHYVSQVYCAALPISYNIDSRPELWELFSRLVLDATYEATLLAGVINAAKPGGSKKIYLTMLGDGALGNQRTWIIDAIRNALDRVRGQSLDVRLVSYARVPADLESLIQEYEN